MIIRMLFKTLQVCLFWALLGAGIILLFQFAVPYLKSATPQLDQIVEKVKPVGKLISEKSQLKSLLENAKQKLAETNVRELIAPLSSATVVDDAATTEPPPVAYPAPQPTRKSRADGDALFARQVSIVDELMK